MKMFCLYFALLINQLNAQNAIREGSELQDARFAGGQEQINVYIADNLIYPSQAAVRHVEGAVTVTFTVGADGSVRNAKIRRSLGHGCDEEALRLVQTMPKWEPALLNGKPVATGKTLQVDFRIIQ